MRSLKALGTSNVVTARMARAMLAEAALALGVPEVYRSLYPTFSTEDALAAWGPFAFACLPPVARLLGAIDFAEGRLTWLIVEPFASDRPEENHNPVGRVYYSASTMLCVPHSLAFHGPGLGAQAGEARLREVVVGGGGFTRFRRATETPFNIVLEARP